MREQQARNESTRRAVNRLPPGPTWRSLPQEVGREIEAWSERRRLRPLARRAFFSYAGRDADRAPVNARDA